MVPSELTNQTPLQPTWGDRVSCIWSAGSCWFIAGMFVTAWWWPRTLDDGRWVKLGVGVLVLEFILIHSGAFLNSTLTQGAGWTREGKVIALAFQSWWIFGSFTLIMTGPVVGVRRSDRQGPGRHAAPGSRE